MIIRKIQGNQISIPKEIQQSLRVKDGDLLELIVTNESLVCKRYSGGGLLAEQANLLFKTYGNPQGLGFCIIDHFSVISANKEMESCIYKKISKASEELSRNQKEEKNIEGVKLLDGAPIIPVYNSFPIYMDDEQIASLLVVNKMLSHEDLIKVRFMAKSLSVQLTENFRINRQ